MSVEHEFSRWCNQLMSSHTLQERQIRESYEQHKDGPHLLEGIATDLEFRFTRAQIRRHLQKLGLDAARRKKQKHKDTPQVHPDTATREWNPDTACQTCRNASCWTRSYHTNEDVAQHGKRHAINCHAVGKC
jgi:hypothetical protein